MPLTIGPNDKNLGKTLTGSEELIAPTQMNLKNIAASPDLSDDEVAALRGAGEVLLQVRVRREFPVLGRVFDDLMGRLKDGAAMKPLTEGETRALIELMGTLSHAEHDALVMLKNRGVIQSSHWDAVVVPHRDASNADQDARLNKAKWGLASVANMSTPVVAAIAVSTVLSGGVVGMVGATAAALGMGLGVTPKVQQAIQTAGRVEARTLGMNALEGKEVSSEVVLLAARVAEGKVFEGGGGPFAQKLNTEVELGTLALNAREKAQIPWSPEEQPFMPLAQDWYYGLADLLAAHEKQPMGDAELRGKAFELRGKVMKQDRLQTVARAFIATTLAARTEDDPRRQGIVFLDHVGQTMAAIRAELGRTNGAVSPEMKDAAASLVKLSGLVKPEVKRESPGALWQGIASIAAGEQQGPDKLKALDQQLHSTGLALQREQKDAGVDEKTARAQVKAAFEALWGNVLPSFQEVGDAPKVKIRDVESDGKGGFKVAGEIQHGWFAEPGAFSMDLTAAGLVDPASIQVDLGPKFAARAAQGAMERAAEMLDKGGVYVTHAEVDKLPNNKDGSYVVRCELVTGGHQDVAVSAMGMVDWSTVRV